jgi:two-component system NtrC family sensor kinase
LGVNGAPVKVLLVEADPADARAVETKLETAQIANFRVECVTNDRDAMLSLAQGHPDVVLLSSQAGKGVDFRGRLRAQAPSTPIIVLTTEDDETVALGAMREGAQDYLVKNRMDGQTLAHGVLYAIQRKRVEEALEKSEAFYHSLVESLPQNILRKDLDGRFTFGNGRFCTEIGSPLEQLVGKTDADFFPPELAAKYRADDLRVIEMGRSFEVVEEHVTPRGEKLYVQVIKSPVYDTFGRVIGIQGIFWDITEKYRAEADLRQAYAELAAKETELLQAMSALKHSHEELIQAQLQLIQAEKLESVGRLAAGVAHEVKNPLAILLMGLEYLTGTCGSRFGPEADESAGAEEDDSAVATVLAAMRDAVERADTIVRGLVDFSANRQFDMAARDMDCVIAQSLLLVKHELTNSHVTVIHERHSTDGPPLPRVTLDTTKIQQVFVNLFMNAIHAMPDGGALTVRAYAKRLGDTERETARDEGSRQAERFRIGDEVVIVEVDDNGIGIPPDKLPKVWDPFFTTKPTGRGTGLGLSVTRKIVELHDGMIVIANRDAGGVRVTLMFHAALAATTQGDQQTGETPATAAFAAIEANRDAIA